MKLNAPVFKVDFRISPESRWDELLTSSWAKRKARLLCRACYEFVEGSTGILAGPLTKVLATAAKGISRSTLGELDYFEDMQAWSHWVVGDLDLVVLANFSYEVHQVKSGLGFCTSVAFESPLLGMVHCRNVDWPLKEIKNSTIILDCKSKSGPFKAVSMPGMVGVLSGVAKGRFSITLNSKEDRNHIVPNLAGWGGTHLLRWIFESCESYEEAVRTIRKMPAFVPFYVTIMGPKSGQACVIEVNRDARNRVYKQANYPVAVANHYPGEICEGSDSQPRQELVEKRALKSTAKSLRGCFSILNKFPVMHSDTVQSMVFHPRSGSVLLQKL